METTNVYLCENCNFLLDEDETRVEERLQSLTVGKEEVEFETPVRLCADCGLPVSDPVLDDQALETAYEIYRQRHKIITPAEIAALRDKYGLTQRGLSNLLGWGEISVHRYEKGRLPDDAHNQLLRFIEDPWNMKKVFDEHRRNIPNSLQKSVEARLSGIMEIAVPGKIEEILEARRKGDPELTGYKRFSSTLLKEMMIFFIDGDGAYKTKLNKLLFYADFCHFRDYSASISGSTYVHLPHGPVADDYDLFINGLLKEGVLTLQEEDCGNAIVEKLVARREARKDIFSSEEIKTLSFVKRHFSAFTSTRIRNFSHDEEAYKRTSDLDPIPYSYAAELHIPSTIS